MTINLYFGLRNMIEYRIGDIYKWAKKGGPEKGGRPPEGTCDGEGYTECPSCGRDFFLRVKIESDIVKSAEPDPDREPYIKDQRPPTFR